MLAKKGKVKVDYCFCIKSKSALFPIMRNHNDYGVADGYEGYHGYDYDYDINYDNLYLQHLCGTDPHPTGFRAKKYKVDISTILIFLTFRNIRLILLSSYYSYYPSEIKGKYFYHIDTH